LRGGAAEDEPGKCGKVMTSIRRRRSQWEGREKGERKKKSGSAH